MLATVRDRVKAIINNVCVCLVPPGFLNLKISVKSALLQ